MSLGIAQHRVRGYRSGVTYLSNQRSSSSKLTDYRAAPRARPSVNAGGPLSRTASGHFMREQIGF